MLFFVEVVVVLFCRHLTFELVVDCVLEKKRGVEGVRSPPRRGGWRGGGALPFAKKK